MCVRVCVYVYLYIHIFMPVAGTTTTTTTASNSTTTLSTMNTIIPGRRWRCRVNECIPARQCLIYDNTSTSLLFQFAHPSRRITVWSVRMRGSWERDKLCLCEVLFFPRG